MSGTPRDREPVNPQVWMAAERTMLAWIRTGLATMGLGFVVARFALFLEGFRAPGHPPSVAHETSLWIGAAIIGAGVAINLVASVLHVRERRRQLRGDPFRPTSWSLGIAVAVGLGLLGLAVAVHLLSAPR
jgi:putative membrane protein